MNVQFMGAARTVTGSCYIIEAAGTRFTVDCGMSQGNSDMDKRNFDTKPYRPGDINFILLTHAHIDHSGLLPRIVRDGFKGPIYCTSPTADLVTMMLEDSAHIQETEAAWNAKHQARFGESTKDTAPLYTIEDARKVPDQLNVIEYNKPFSPHPGITVCYRDAGHILGAAFLELTVEENGKTTRVVFSGDLGRPGTLLMHHPSTAAQSDYLFLESTYGDRDHKNEDASLDELHQAIMYAYSHREKVIIPAFAVGRTQEILYCLFLLRRQKRLPEDLPIYVDSPMAIKATEIFVKYKDYLNTPELSEPGADFKGTLLPNLHFTLSAAESQALNNQQGPGIVIAASGMCNAGRIKHHLRHNAWKPGAAIVFVGYQGVGTPGRKIVDGAKSIRLFKENVAIKAKVFTIGGFSAHAGQSQLLKWLGDMQHPGMHVILVHGEDTALETLSRMVHERFGLQTSIPDYHDIMELAPGAVPVVQVQQDEEAKHVNWNNLLPTTEMLMNNLHKELANLHQLPRVKQVEIRDHLIEINKELMVLLSEL